MVRVPEQVIVITDPETTDRQPDDQPPVIIHPMEHNGPPYIPTVREMFISVHSQTVTGNNDKTEPGHR
jgi:hypothetical protein